MKRTLVWSITVLFLLTGPGCTGEPFAGQEAVPATTDAADSRPDTVQSEAYVADAAPDRAKEAEAGVPETGPEPKPELQPEAGPDIQAEDAKSDMASETSSEADVDAAPQDVNQPDAVKPDAIKPDGQVADAVAEDAAPQTPCQKWGESGKITVVVELAADPPAGHVLGAFGTVSYSSPDAGASTGYQVWKLNPLFPTPPDTPTRIIMQPASAISNPVLIFEPGITMPGNADFNTWVYRCDASTCPASDKYQVCDGLNFMGGWIGGQLTGACDFKLSGNMQFEQLRCTKP